MLVLVLLGGGGYLLGTHISGSEPAPSTQAQTKAGQRPADKSGSGAGTTSTDAAPSTTTTTASTTTTAERPRTGPRFDATAAAAKVRSLGYSVDSSTPSGYGGPLSVVVGSCTGSAGGSPCQQAFFFDANNYIGTATYDPAQSLAVSSQAGSSVTLSYPRYVAGDAACCPSGAATEYTFTLNPGGASVTAAPSLPQDPNRP